MKNETYDGQPITEQQKYHDIDTDYIARRWDKRAKGWNHEINDEKSHLNRAGSYQKFFEIFDKILPGLPVDSHGTLVDLGSGTGAMVERYHKYFAKVYGVDISSAMLAEAQRNLSEKHIRWVCDNIFHYLENMHDSDVIISRGIILSHYGKENTQSLLHLMHQSLTDTGLVFLDMINDDAEEKPFGKASFTKDSIYALANKAGFSRINIYHEYKYPLMYMEAYK